MSVTQQLARTGFRALRRSPVRPWIAARAAPNDRGDRLDPDVAALLWVDRIRGTPITGTTVAEARKNMVASSILVEGSARRLAEIRDLEVGDRPGRLYVPRADSQGRLLVFFHGGGWVVGGIRSHDRLCQSLADHAGQRVLSVDYRLAPEHPFPVPVHDAVAAFQWAREHAEALGARPDRIAVGGDSAGGNLAAVVCLVHRDRGGPQPAFQLLIYPATDFRRVTASHRALAEGYLLTRDSLDWYQLHYAPDIYDPLASPLLAPDHAGLAATIVVNAGFDPLRDDGELNAGALRAAGVPVTQLDFPAQIHGFLSMGGVIPAAAKAVLDVAAACAVRYA